MTTLNSLDSRAEAFNSIAASLQESFPAMKVEVFLEGSPVQHASYSFASRFELQLMGFEPPTGYAPYKITLYVNPHFPGFVAVCSAFCATVTHVDAVTTVKNCIKLINDNLDSVKRALPSVHL